MPSDTTTVPTEVINNPSIKWADLGVLTYLLAHPEASPTELLDKRKAGKHVVYGAFKRLRDAGYVDYERRADGTTTWFVTIEAASL